LLVSVARVLTGDDAARQQPIAAGVRTHQQVAGLLKGRAFGRVEGFHHSRISQPRDNRCRPHGIAVTDAVATVANLKE
jgi:hypothetical protein